MVDRPQPALADQFVGEDLPLEELVAATPRALDLVVWEPSERLQQAIRTALGPQSEHWEATFVRTADELRAELARPGRTVDVVLADVDASGTVASVLAEVSLRAPGALRVVVGRPGDDTAMVDAVNVAHRFEPRPLDLPGLLDDLARTQRRRAAVGDHDALRAALGDTSMPSPPGLWLQLTQALEDPEVGAAEMGAMVESDVAISAKALSLANSAWFGLPRRVTDVRDAVVLLGGDAVQALVLAAELSSSLGEGVGVEWLEAFEAHAAAVAHACTVVAPPALKREALAAGLLHDVGTLLLRRHHLAAMEAGEQMPLDRRLQYERDLFGATHAEVGAALLSAWGLPDSLVDAVLGHHAPYVGLLPTLDLAGVVHVADALLRRPDEVREDGLPLLDALDLGEWVEPWHEALHTT